MNTIDNSRAMNAIAAHDPMFYNRRRSKRLEKKLNVGEFVRSALVIKASTDISTLDDKDIHQNIDAVIKHVREGYERSVHRHVVMSKQQITKPSDTVEYIVVVFFDIVKAPIENIERCLVDELNNVVRVHTVEYVDFNRHIYKVVNEPNKVVRVSTYS